jgi:hypothetical protein
MMMGRSPHNNAMGLKTYSIQTRKEFGGIEDTTIQMKPAKRKEDEGEEGIILISSVFRHVCIF